jgi:hypothetical protein
MTLKALHGNTATFLLDTYARRPAKTVIHLFLLKLEFPIQYWVIVSLNRYYHPEFYRVLTGFMKTTGIFYALGSTTISPQYAIPWESLKLP